MRSVRARVRRWLSPTVPDLPDDEEGHEGATEDWSPAEDINELEVDAITDEFFLDPFDEGDRALAVEFLAVRVSLAELVDRFDGWVEQLLGEWQPGWREEPAVPLPDFRTVHALIDDTGAFPVVEMAGAA